MVEKLAASNTSARTDVGNGTFLQNHRNVETLLYFSSLFVKRFSLGFNFSISFCDNTVRVFCLGFRHQNHLVRVRKRSFLA